jgi:hypothetical protein
MGRPFTLRYIKFFVGIIKTYMQKALCYEAKGLFAGMK